MASQRIPSLDGLRAVSILMVILAHIVLHESLWHPIALIGTVGVNVFFIISGFLITTLLLRELDDSRKISLSGFYIRRALRIFPVAYAYIGCVMILSMIGRLPLLGSIQLNSGDIFYSLTYLMAYHQSHASVSLAHLWSISVEEQFYLLWPLALVLLQRKARFIAISIVAVMPLIRAGLWLQFGDRPDVMNLIMPHSVDAIALGCCLAFYPGISAKFGSKLPAWSILLLLFCAWGILAVPVETMPNIARKILRLSQDSISHMLVTLMLTGIIAMSTSATVSRVLNSKAMIFIGVLSYALYIWQELFLINPSMPILYGIPLTWICAWASHQWIEQPFLRIKDRFHRVKAA